MDECRQIEHSIIKKYRKQIWAKFVKGIQTYDLIHDGDRIAVCISGGKDSMLMAKCFQELKRHGKMNFELVFIVMDPGYHKRNLELILNNARKMGIPIQVFQSDIFEVVTSVETGSPCYLCARMRRGYLYHKARELGCNKIALGHHYDDVLETILLNLLYGAEIKTMMPKLHSKNYENMELIRPMYLMKEADIITWAKGNGLTFLNCACRFTEALDQAQVDSKRLEMKQLITQFRKISPYIEKNIFRSVENINLNAVIGYRKDGKKMNFLDDYE